MSEQSTRDLLTAALGAAVPLAILDMKDWTFEARQAKALECSGIIASQGDIILYRSSRKGETAKAFTALAFGLAALAYQPGGVTFMELHFCTDHDECKAAAKAAAEMVPA